MKKDNKTQKKIETRMCRRCKERDIITDMKHVVTEKGGHLYYHPACLKIKEKENVKDERDELEREERERMHEYLAGIYGISTDLIPTRTYAMLTNLRNGNPLFKGKPLTKRYREGYTYEIIRRTYAYVQQDIEIANQRKGFDSISKAINYGLHIVLDKIAFVAKKVEAEDRAREQSDIQHSKAIEKDFEDLSTKIADDSENHNKRRASKVKNKNDISQFLD